MKLEDVPAGFRRSAVSIGVYDGVHIGHQSLLAVLRAEAERLGGVSTVFTFYRSPRALLAPEREPLYINTPEQKFSLLEQSGADVVVAAEFDQSMANLSPREFVERVLIGRLKAGAVVVGSTFKFGHNRAGNINTLRALGEEHGFRVVGLEPTAAHGSTVSSTRIRHGIERGDVETVSELLGRPFTMLGQVVAGLGLGRKLGFPTANIEVADRQIVPGEGVYAVEAIVDSAPSAAACSIGTRPTIDGTDCAVEVLIDGYDEDIYGREIGVAFHHRLRDQRKFDNIEALKVQIGLDMEDARKLLRRRV